MTEHADEPPFISDGPCGESGGCAAMPGCRCPFAIGPPFISGSAASTSPPTFSVRWVALWRHPIDVEAARDDYNWDAAPGWQTWTVTRFTTSSGRT